MTLLYRILRDLVFFFMRFVHPVFRVTGRGNVPPGRAVICCNHSNLSDPLWLIFALRLPEMPSSMAKKELLAVPVLGPFVKAFRVIGVDRAHNDIAAVKAALGVLRHDEKLIIFPEGTRVRPGKQVQAKTGAALLAARTGAPLVPVYLTKGKHLFRPLRCVIGAPLQPQYAGAKPTGEELERTTQQLMREIYAMGERA